MSMQGNGYGRYVSYSNEQYGRQNEVDRQGNFVLYKPTQPEPNLNYSNLGNTKQTDWNSNQQTNYGSRNIGDTYNRPNQPRSQSSTAQPLSQAFGQVYNPPEPKPQTPMFIPQNQGEDARNGTHTTNFVRSQGGRDPIPTFYRPQPQPAYSSHYSERPATNFVNIPNEAPVANQPNQDHTNGNLPYQSNKVPTFTRSLNSNYTPNTTFVTIHPTPPSAPQQIPDHQTSQQHGERSYSASPLQRTFKNSLATTPVLQYHQSNPLPSQETFNLSGTGINNFSSTTVDYANSNTGRFPNNSNISNSLSRVAQPHQLSHHQSAAYSAQDMNDHGNTYETRMMAVAKEREKMKALGTHKQMMESLLDQKFKEFKNVINKNLKERFDSELKRALFHLWKHYKNCNEKHEKHMTQEDIERSIFENLRKVNFETNELKDKNRFLADQVRDKEIETTDLINKQIKEYSMIGNSKEQANSVSVRRPYNTEMTLDQRKYFLESQMQSFSGEVEKNMEAIKDIQRSRQQKVYEAQLHLENEGRERMSEIARGHILEYCPVDGNPGLLDLRNEVAYMKADYQQTRTEWIENGYGQNPIEYKINLLEQNLFDLEKTYESIMKH